MKKILFATHNKKKLAEIAQMLEGSAFQVVSAGDVNCPDVEETGKTFIENALLKAHAGAQHSGLPTLADDSGLIVPALNGEPGVYSARYAGLDAKDSDNNQKLLEALSAFDENSPERQAFYYCVLVFLRHPDDPTPIIAEGQWHGTIAAAPRGDQGFGYDPIFITQSGQSAAELSPANKHQLSHRGQALRALVNTIDDWSINHS